MASKTGQPFALRCFALCRVLERNFEWHFEWPILKTPPGFSNTAWKTIRRNLIFYKRVAIFDISSANIGVLGVYGSS
jgi:hypothetical protein